MKLQSSRNAAQLKFCSGTRGLLIAREIQTYFIEKNLGFFVWFYRGCSCCWCICIFSLKIFQASWKCPARKSKICLFILLWRSAWQFTKLWMHGNDRILGIYEHACMHGWWLCNLFDSCGMILRLIAWLRGEARLLTTITITTHVSMSSLPFFRCSLFTLLLLQWSGNWTLLLKVVVVTFTSSSFYSSVTEFISRQTAAADTLFLQGKTCVSLHISFQ